MARYRRCRLRQQRSQRLHIRLPDLAVSHISKIPCSRKFTKSFLFPRSTSPLLALSKALRRVSQTPHNTCARHPSRRAIHTMPPKQGTLRYVKAKQQTPGCMLPILQGSTYIETNDSIVLGNSLAIRMALLPSRNNLPWLFRNRRIQQGQKLTAL